MQKHTFKAPRCCFENAPYTELTIVCTINVSIDCKKNEVSNPINVSIDCKKNEVSNLIQEKNILDYSTKQSVALFVFCF